MRLTQISSLNTSAPYTNVQIFDNGVLLPGGILGGGNRVEIVGLYQNGAVVGQVYYYNQRIAVDNKIVLWIYFTPVDSGYTFKVQLRRVITSPSPRLQNGNYDLIVRYYGYDGNNKYLLGTFTVPLLVDVPE